MGYIESAPRGIEFRSAVSPKSWARTINHPSGDPEPSREDLEVTKHLTEAGRILGIEVLDHVIVGSVDRFVSLRESLGHL